MGVTFGFVGRLPSDDLRARDDEAFGIDADDHFRLSREFTSEARSDGRQPMTARGVNGALT